MVKKKSKSSSPARKSLFNLTNIILFILLIIAVLWIYSYSSIKKNSYLKGELNNLGFWDVEIVRPECTTDADCSSNLHCKTSGEGRRGKCVDCITDSHCLDASQPICDNLNRCVECLTNNDCYPAAPICDPWDGWCKICIDDVDCPVDFPNCVINQYGQNTCATDEVLI